MTNSFSKNVHAECLYLGISLRELAKRTGISYTTILSYTKSDGALPRCDLALRIAKALNVSIEYLMTGETSTFAPKVHHYSLVSDLKNLDPRYLPALSSLIHELATSKNQ